MSAAKRRIKRKIKMLGIAAMVLLTGCAREAERSESAGREFTVDTLFTKEGCTVYRFYDAGYYRYFTNCSGSTMSTISTGSGKTQHYEPDDIRGGRP